MNANTFTRAALLGAMVALLPSCSQESKVCSLICDCTHCNDYANDVLCDELSTESDVASAYGCDTEWGDWLTCIQDQGSCNDTTATFEVTAPGSCTGTTSTGVACPTGTCPTTGWTCVSGQCMMRTCQGSAQTCTMDSECTGGVSYCDHESQKLNDCLDHASDRHAPYFKLDL